MAVLSRLLIGSQQRLDLPDLLSMSSYTASDFKFLIKSLVGSAPLILKGFDIIDAPSCINTTSVSIRVADSVLYNTESSSGSFYYGLPEGNEISQPISPTLRANATNYIYLTLSSSGEGKDTRAFFDVDLNGGEGGEFNQDVNTQSVLKIDVNVSVSTFPTGTVPIAKIQTGANAIITSITDCRDMMFRLGSGGANPNPLNKFSFRSLPESIYERDEPLLTINSSASSNSFQGGDKNIYTLKEWMDAVMTKLLELSGTTFWYESTPTLNLSNIHGDALATSIKSKGSWTHSVANPGRISWSEDIVIRRMNDPRDIIIRSNSSGEDLLDDQIMWVKLEREKQINELDSPIEFEYGESYINGTVGSFENIKKGDWIKRHGDDNNLYLRVEELYNGLNASGDPTSPENAISIKLSGVYVGPTVTDSAVFTKGEYENEDILISNRSSSDLFVAGGDLFWLANRSDTIQKIESIANFSKTATVSEVNTETLKLTFDTAHGLSDGDRITLSDDGYYSSYQVEVESTLSVIVKYYGGLQNGEVLIARWGVVKTSSRSTDDGFQLESANHNFESNQTVIINGAAGYGDNQKYQINNRSSTEFQIPSNVDSNLVTDLTGVNATATCARVNLRTEFGAARVVQGETVDINEPDTFNILKFIGMDSLAQTSPVYKTPDGYNALDGYQDFNSSPDDSVTARISKLTAMMADRVQDRGSKIVGRATYRNTSTGGNQVVTVNGSIVIEKPGSTQQSITTGSSFTLAANQALVCDIDRQSGAPAACTVQSLGSSFLLKENRIVLFYRFSGTSVYSWDGHEIKNSSSWTSNDYETSQNKNIIIEDVGGIKYANNLISYNSSAGQVKILIPGSLNNTINCASINGLSSLLRTVLNDQSVWIRINRNVAKTFSTITTNAAYQDTDAVGALYVTNTTDVPTDQDVVVLYSVRSGVLYRHNHATPAGNIYEESKIGVLSATTTYQFNTPFVSGTNMSLPQDSREDATTQNFVVGSGQLQVWLNGQKLRLSDDYNEVGVTGALSNTVSILRDLEVDDVVTFRVDGNSAVYFTPSPSVVEDLQDAYDGGNIINIDNGSPITINGSTGQKLLQINGDIGVTGVIDPKAITFTKETTNPIGTSQNGLWVNTSGQLIHQNSTVSLNITQSISDPSTMLTAGNGLVYSNGNKTLDVNLSSTGGVQIVSDALEIKKADLSLQTTASGLSVKKSTNSGLTVDASGLAVNPSSTGGLEVLSNSLKIKSADTALYTNVSGISILNDNSLKRDISGWLGVSFEPESSGLVVDYSTEGLQVFASAPIVVTTNGVGLSYSGDTLGLNGSAQLDVFSSPRVQNTMVNGSGAILNPGVVSVLGTNTVQAASSTNMSSFAKIVGVVGTSTGIGSTCSVVSRGKIQITGAGFTVGNPVYLSHTTNGSLTQTKPSTYGKPIILIGTATATNEMFVNVQMLGVAGNVYAESVVVAIDTAAPSTLTLPTDSRASGSIRYYTVGSAFLTVWLNGQKLRLGDDYNEIVMGGDLSNTISMLRDLEVGDIVEYRIEKDQSVHIASL